MGEMDEEDLLKEHANKLECDYERGKERTPVCDSSQMKVR
jgi:hypothetical protein